MNRQTLRVLKASLSMLRAVFGVLVISVTINNAVAQQETAEQKGLRIAQEADRRDQGFGDSKSDMIMVLRDSYGTEAKRLLRTRTLEQMDDGDKTLIIFDSPADVKGTAMLSFTHKIGSDDQWLFLPEIQRVKRISQSNKSGPFMGSEFAYEDMSSQEVEKYTYRYLRDELLDGNECFVIEFDPVDKKSGYHHQLVWIDKTHFYAHKVDFYDRKNTLLKTLRMTEYKLYLEKFWRAANYSMVNHQSGKSTVLDWQNITFNNGYTDKDFSKNALKKAR